ncbi:hypothetical protein [Streptomyces tubercidicus]
MPIRVDAVLTGVDAVPTGVDAVPTSVTEPPLGCSGTLYTAGVRSGETGAAGVTVRDTKVAVSALAPTRQAAS